jgi:hypothetical protein
MQDSNQFCEQPNCGATAYMFGFTSKSIKTRVCREHLFTLTDKQILPFPIEFDQLLESLADATFYQSRKQHAQRGIGTVQAMQTRRQHDMEEAVGRLDEMKKVVIEAVEREFMELERQLECRNAAIEQELNECLANLKRFEKEKNFELRSQEKLMCEDQAIRSLFQLVVEDCSLQIAETILESVKLLPIEDIAMVALTDRSNAATDLLALAEVEATQGKVNIAAEITNYAVELEPEVSHPDYNTFAEVKKQEASKRLCLLQPSRATEQEVKAMAVGYQALGVTAPCFSNLNTVPA